MKSFRTISAFLLATLVMLSSTSFMVGIHYCQGDIESISLFAKSEGCAKAKQLPPCHRHTTAPCCDDESVIHEGDEFKFSESVFHSLTNAPCEAIAPMVLIAEVVPASFDSGIHYQAYDPPLLSTDIIVEHAVFLI